MKPYETRSFPSTTDYVGTRVRLMGETPPLVLDARIVEAYDEEKALLPLVFPAGEPDGSFIAGQDTWKEFSGSAYDYCYQPSDSAGGFVCAISLGA